MSLIGVCLLPANANNNATLTARLTRHLSRRFPEQEHEPFHIDYHLFNDTSSQVPGADVKQRAFTHILSVSHKPDHTFVRSTRSGKPEHGTTITIPRSSTDSFTQLLLTKMQPLWSSRQVSVLERGVSVTFEEPAWRFCVGDLKVAAKQHASGSLRGVLLEMRWKDFQLPTNGDDLSQDEIAEIQELFRSALNQTFKGVETFDGANFTIKRTKADFSVDSNDKDNSDVDSALADVYMTVLKGQR